VSDDAPHLSVVIPAYNEEKYLPRTLQALTPVLADLGVPAEVIVADDASDDRTAELAARAGCRVVACDHRQISRTRNAGAAEARARHILFLDADTLATSEVVAAAWRALENGAVGGGCRMDTDGEFPVRSLRFALGLWNRLSRVARWAAGGFFFCRGDAFREVGGFPDDLYAGEEIALSRRLGRWGRARDRQFVILRERVLTSPRKAHLYSPAELRRLLVGVLLRGPAALRDRRAVSPWYDGRR
jgi:glycosyltransferase involved in cell wall biosynthesis